jgi:predicted Zn-ribbon and HTH transcriptional regulator
MKNEIIIPVLVHDLKEEDVISTNERTRKYTITRDLQAAEFNSSIVTRLLKESERRVKCEKCGKEFSVGIEVKDYTNCPDCKSVDTTPGLSE